MTTISDDAMMQAMKDAGIPRVIREDKQASLSHINPGCKLLVGWITSAEIYTSVTEGESCLFTGASRAAMAAFYLTARALLLRGIAVKVYSLPRIIEAVNRPDGDEELLDEWRDKLDVSVRRGAIFIAGFQSAHYDKPYTAKEFYKLEWFMREQVADSRSFFLQADEWSARWWSAPFIELMKQRSKGRVVPVA